MVASHLIHERIDGRTYLFTTSDPPVIEPSDAAFLLPIYDEFLIGFSVLDRSRALSRYPNESRLFDSTIVVGGQVAGSWRRLFTKEAVVIELAPFAPLAAAEAEAVAAAARRYGAFFGMPVVLS